MVAADAALRSGEDMAASAHSALTTASLPPTMFGRTPGAAVFAAALAAARVGQADGARAEQLRAHDLARRAATSGDLGSGLITDTTAIANSSTPSTP